MDTEEIRDALEDVGLSHYQAEAYVTLVELGSAPAAELTKACDVPQARIYDVIRDLEEMGYVETYDRESLHARANEPTEAIAMLHDRAETAVEAAEAIEERWERPDVEEHRVSVVNRFDTVRKRATEYVADADYLVQLAATPDQFRALTDELAAARERGVDVKLSLHPERPDEEFAVSDAVTDAFPDAATEVRYRDMPVPFVLLVDRERACFAPAADVHPSNEYGMLIADYSLGQVFEWYFDTALWESGEPVYDGRAEEPPITYASIRDCLADVEPLVESGATVELRVEGRFRGTDEEVTVEGEVADVIFGGGTGEDGALRRFADRATVFLDTGEDVVEVGGWGAVYEDVEARRLVVTAVEE